MMCSSRMGNSTSEPIMRMASISRCSSLVSVILRYGTPTKVPMPGRPARGTDSEVVVDAGTIDVVAIRVFLLDDHALVREGIRSLLEDEPDIEVVGEAGTAEEAMTRVPLARPDVAILDVRLKDSSGIEVCRDLRSTMPELACLMLTSFADDEALFASVMAGAAGSVLKQIKAGDLIENVRRVARGGAAPRPAGRRGASRSSIRGSSRV